MSAMSMAAQRAVALAALVPLLAMIVVHAASAADLAPIRRLDPGDARRGGLAVTLQRTPGPPASVVEVRGADGAPFAGALLAVAPDGAAAALADAPGRAATALVIAAADGSQVRLAMAGLLAAAFSPDGRRLAAVDGHGRLWSVDAATAEARPLAEGPFIDVPLVEADGTAVALAVPSVEAPFRSRLVAIDPAGTIRSLSDEPLVYDAARLADGSLVAVAHRPTGTVLLALGAAAPSLLADLGPDAVNVSLTADAAVIAWETAGRVFARAAGGAPTEIGAGSTPSVAPDGRAILVRRDGGSTLVDLAGRDLGRFATASAFIGCEECAS
jgi:hypothetical protein